MHKHAVKEVLTVEASLNTGLENSIGFFIQWLIYILLKLKYQNIATNLEPVLFASKMIHTCLKPSKDIAFRINVGSHQAHKIILDAVQFLLVPSYILRQLHSLCILPLAGTWLSCVQSTILPAFCRLQDPLELEFFEILVSDY
jgi:hypothetical protein